MAAANQNGPTSLIPGLTISMTEYDSFPYSVRQALSDFPYRVGLSAESRHILATQGGEACAKRIRQLAPSHIRSSALMAYGPDHPQAQ